MCSIKECSAESNIVVIMYPTIHGRFFHITQFDRFIFKPQSVDISLESFFTDFTNFIMHSKAVNSKLNVE